MVSTTHAQEAGCEAPAFEVDVFSAALAPDGTRSVVLSFDDPNPAGVATGYHIYRSPNPGLPLSAWSQTANAVVDSDASAPGIQWFETDGALPATGIWFYLATAYSEPCAEEEPWKSLRVNDTRDARDRMPGDGACLSEGGGCTLRAADGERPLP
jgi:hypothetical protein